MRPFSSALAIAGTSIGILLVACVGDDPTGTTPASDGGASSSGNTSSSGGTSSSGTPGADACATSCNGQCVDTQTDPANCGACGKSCTTAAGKSFSCVAGECGNKAVKVAMGTYSACLVLRDGSVWCWGLRETGLTGEVATSTNTPIPTKVNGLSKIVDVSVGHEHACALEEGGDVWCWGYNNFLQTGVASNATDCTGPGPHFCHVPRKVPLPAKAAQISAGAATNCARTVGASGGDVYCWGRNSSGVISTDASGTSNDTKLPTKIATFAGDVLEVSVSADDSASATGPRLHACAVKANGQVWCWGANLWGELGHPDGSATCPRGSGTIFCTPVPKAAVVGGTTTPLSDVKSVRAMIDATCVLKNDKTVWCWGSRFGGQTGKTTDGSAHPDPTQVLGLDPASHFDAKGYNAWVVDANGNVKGWGVTDYYNVGIGTGDKVCTGGLRCIDAPVAIPALVGATQIGGGLHSSAALQAAKVVAWGRNSYAQLGHATNTSDDKTCQSGGEQCNDTPRPVGDLP